VQSGEGHHTFPPDRARHQGKLTPAFHLLAQRMTGWGGLLCPGSASQFAPLSPRVLGVSAITPVFTMQVALTIISSSPHMAAFTIPPSVVPRTTRNCGGGETPSLPSFPGGPAGPCGPGEPAIPAGPGSPLSPLSPFSPFTPQPVRAKADSSAQTIIAARFMSGTHTKANGNSRSGVRVPAVFVGPAQSQNINEFTQASTARYGLWH
jgi:hypothetical protein